MKSAIAEAKTALGPAEMQKRIELFVQWAGKVLEDIAIRARRQQKTREDELEMPILRSMQALASGMAGGAAAATSAAPDSEPPTASLGSSMGF